MPRRLRVVCPGRAHHVIARGNYRQNVLEQFKDFKQYCYWVKEYQHKYGLDVVSYCLMNNHVHFILVPKDEDGLSRLFNALHMRYSQYKNGRMHKKGHLWQGRYSSSIIEERGYLLRVVRCVEQNPVRAKMVEKAWDYVWSSARTHVGIDKDPIIKTVGCKQILDQLGGVVTWKEYLCGIEASVDEEIRTSTHKGYVIGSEGFAHKMEQEMGTRLTPGKVGRPKKK
jgi:putative transposase